MNHIINPINIEVGVKGFLRCRCINKYSGKTTQDTGWFPNTILNAGKNVMATRSDWMNYCQVGVDGTFPPLLADRQAETSLGSWHAGTANVTTTSYGQAGSPPYYGYKRKTWRFLAGTVATNLSEAGVGWAVGPGSSIMCRAPILDPVLQTPTTVTPLADELLDVMYELRYYPPLVDVTSPQVTLDGITYNTITRAANVTGEAWSASIGSAIGVGNILYWIAYDGDIGAITSSPSGASSGGSSYRTLTNSAYSNNSYMLQVNCSAQSLGWNLGAGIRSILIRTTAGDYQTQFNAVGTDNRIPKTSGYTMTMNWIISWTEKV